jgi:hypothetical protein
MKAIPLRSAAALALALALSACGGKASFDITGTFIDAQGNLKPLANPGLVLANGGDTVAVPVGATSFKFPNSISYGTEYNILVQKQPDHMTCNVLGGSGSAGRLVSITATVNCTQNSYTIGGTVTGITGDATVTLTNGSTGGTVTLNKDSSTFTFQVPVFDGQSYGVTVYTITPDTTTPANLACTVANGTDVMGTAPRTNIVVTCAKA